MIDFRFIFDALDTFLLKIIRERERERKINKGRKREKERKKEREKEIRLYAEKK